MTGNNGNRFYKIISMKTKVYIDYEVNMLNEINH